MDLVMKLENPIANPQLLVAMFQEHVCNLQLPEKPSLIDSATTRTCIRLMNEEYGELVEAMWKCVAYQTHSINPTTEFMQDKYAPLADGIADLLYVIYYTANCYGIDVEPIFNEVQRSNMTKVGGVIDKNGKLQKASASSYVPPNLVPILMEQIG